MPTSESIKEIASKLAKELKPKISNKSSHPYAWLFVHAAEKDRFLIRDRLLEDEAFHETIAAKFKKRFGSDPSKNVVHANPIIWTERGGSVAAPFPKQYLVIIALEDLDQNNGMPLITNGTLACGEYIVLSGEDTLQFNNKGGGLAFFVILSL